LTSIYIEHEVISDSCYASRAGMLGSSENPYKLLQL